MTGPEHYREAEHLAKALPACMCAMTGCVHEQMQLARAQVHATLALAAATAMNDAEGGMVISDRNEWRRTVGVNVPAEAAEVTR